jgi:competence protein ComEC
MAVLAGAVGGLLVADGRPPDRVWLLPLCVAFGWGAWFRSCDRVVMAMIVAGCTASAFVLTTAEREGALHTTLREILDAHAGGFLIETPGPARPHQPVRVSAVLREDASRAGAAATLHASARAVWLDGIRTPASGGITMTIGGAASPFAEQWRAGRTIETFATFRRPARYLNDGVPDLERDLALSGITLFGSAKSGLLVEVVGRGTVVEEIGATVRAHVRRSVERWVGRYGAVEAGIVTAVLIGDRTGLPPDVRLRLQAAGTYHVIAISGGNIAILAGLSVGLLLLCGVSGRPAALVTIVLLIAYAHVVTAGASVWRATVMAVLYLAARLFDHRSPPWQALAVAAALVMCVRPLQVRDAGFILTFGATAALLEAARRVMKGSDHHGRTWIARWLAASLAASLAAEVALLPVSAWTFSRVTSAGLVLNLAAVPLMAIVQVAGLAVAICAGVEWIAGPAGWMAHEAAGALVSSAGLVDVAPWLSARVPQPPFPLIAGYYAGLAFALAFGGVRCVAGAAIATLCTAAIVTGQPAGWISEARQPAAFRLTVFDVGQGDAALLRFPDRSRLLVDAGGIPFAGGTFDIGSRVLSPALWALGVRALSAVALTHGDPDHIGGARAIVEDFAPVRLWEGVPVGQHAPLQEVLHEARASGAAMGRLIQGHEWSAGGVRIRVLHPPAPDWERRRVRNDDSLVFEVVYGDVALLLPGDIGADVERTLLPHLTMARHRILKVAHHGSRTSTSPDLLAHWRPQVAIISAGRGNTFGHPTSEVLQRLKSIGAQIYRTDLDGQIHVETDGTRIRVTTYVGKKT